MKNKILKKFKNYLKKSSYKSTPERYEILDAIVLVAGEDGSGHFGVDDIFLSARSLNHNYSLATIYRNLSLFLDANVLSPTASSSGMKCYELVAESHHDHLVCIKCGKVEQFFNKDLEILQENICESHNFKETYHQLTIKGICSDCQKDF